MSLNEVRPGRPEQSNERNHHEYRCNVSMKSGLEDRNNPVQLTAETRVAVVVSMKSGLEDRNNHHCRDVVDRFIHVSMKSGLEDRNNRDKVAKLAADLLSQ